MIITRTPFRVSFFGGGTDYPAWYRQNGGAVISTTVDKYCYITCRPLPPFFSHKFRIVYSEIENVSNIDDIRHPAVQNIFKWANITEGLEVHYDGDLPARSGLGSSSAFTVGLCNALHTLNGTTKSSYQLARDAIHIEQNLIGENVGSQDQTSVAIGGLNRIDFQPDDSFSVTPLSIGDPRKEELRRHFLLGFTGVSRIADEIAYSQISNMSNRYSELSRMQEIVDEAEALLLSDAPIDQFGYLLDESWNLKKNLSNKVSSKLIDELYFNAKSKGAIGGKILGAGGGGFILIFAKPEYHQAIKDHLKPVVFTDFNYENTGSQVVFNSNSLC